MSDHLLEETSALLEDYLQRRLCKDHPAAHTPVAETLWRVAEEMLNTNRVSYEPLPGDPRVILRRVAEEMSQQGGLNWGRVIALIVFTGVLAQKHRDHKMGTPKELALVLSQCLIGDHRDWIQKNGGWEGFHKVCSKTRTDQLQENGTFTNALMAAAGFGIAGLVFLLAVR